MKGIITVTLSFNVSLHRELYVVFSFVLRISPEFEALELQLLVSAS
jgi:hypothetical protein